MKKGLTIAALSALSLSAVAVAPAQQASAAETPENGFYNIQDKSFISLTDFKKLSKAEKKALFANQNVYFVSGGTVTKSFDIISKTNAELKTPAVSVPLADFEAANGKVIDEINNQVNVATVTATNGTVTVTLNKEVTAADIADFKVTQKIGSGESKAVTPSKVELGADKKTVTITVAEVKATDAEQSVVTSVAYKTTAAKSAAAFNVAAVVGVKVEDVKAINPTTIQVTYNQDPKAADLVASNFTLSKGTVEAVTATGKVATISVKGLTYGDKTTVTIGSTVKEVTVPQVSELYNLEITTDAANDTIKSDGAAKTQITVTLKDKLTGKVVDKDGIIQFSATRGGLGQTTSALQDGKATVQLSSVASATSQTSIVTAVVSDVPGAAEFEGLSGQKAVVFSPDVVDGGQVKFVQAVKAESTQGDRLFVTFSDKITAEAYKDAVKASTTDTAALKIAYGINIDGKAVAVSDVVQKTDNTLEFILDTDVATSAKDTDYQRIEQTDDWQTPDTATVGQKNYLRDNVTHNVTFPKNVGSLVLGNTTKIPFILTDTSKPAVLGVTAKDQLEFSVRFTESMDERTVEKLDATVKNPNFLLDGREVLVIASPSAGEVATAKTKNQVILTSLQVGNYAFTKDGKETTVLDKDGKATDTRNIVTYKVHKDFVLSTGVHQIQIAKVGDWAQDVDQAQNLVATDTFDFTVTADISVPAATIEVQSAEQWLVTFDKPVYTSGAKKAQDVFALKSADTTDTFVYGTDYTVSSITKDGKTGSEIAAGSSISGQQYFLIQFKKDWTVKYETNANALKTYFASTKNPYVLTLDNLESAIGNKVGKKELNVNLTYDGVSPKIATATQVKTAQGAYTSNVDVVMSEPVKNVGTHDEGLTPSEQQATNAGVPVPTYELVKGDKVVKATASKFSYDNKAFTLSPVDGATLEAGEWTLYIRSISDDIGNTSATESTKVTIAAVDQAVTSTRLAWAAFDDAGLVAGETNTTGGKLLNDPNKDNDVIYVKFTKEMKADGANGVSRTQNYVFMGQPLPEGSQVIKGITGVTNAWDGVTILLPKGTWNGTGTGNNNFTNALNIASNFAAADGEALSGAYEVELTDTATTTAALQDGFEAAYADAGATTSKPNQVTFGGLGEVKGATVDTAGIVSGKIDVIKLTLDAKHEAIAAGKEVLVNGKTFITSAAAKNAGTVTLTAKTNNQIDGTATNNLKITGLDGSIIVNTGSVKDAAGPVITKAELNADKTKLTVTFSEAVTNNTGSTTGTFTSVDKGDFTFTTATPNTVTVSTVEHNEATPNKVVLTITNGESINNYANTVNDTVLTARTLYDFVANEATGTFSPITGATTDITTTTASLVVAGTPNTANVVTLGAGETITATSNNTGVATVDVATVALSSTITVSGIAGGSTTITVEVKNSAGIVVRRGTITVTVTPDN